MIKNRKNYLSIPAIESAPWFCLEEGRRGNGTQGRERNEEGMASYREKSKCQ